MQTMEPIDVARFEERRLALAMSEIAAETAEIGAGTMSYDAPGSWANQACALGLDGPVDAETVDRVVAWYAERDEPAHIEMPAPAHPTLLEHVKRRRFLVHNFENVFAIEPAAAHLRLGDDELPAGLHLGSLDIDDDEAVRDFADMTTGAFEPRRQPDGTVRPMQDDELEIMRRVVSHPNVVSVTVRDEDGSLAAIAGMEIRTLAPFLGGPGGPAGTTCCLFGAVTREDKRRAGLQGLLIRERIAIARERGAGVVTIGSKPGIPTERNARRHGFALAYTKAGMRRPLDTVDDALPGS